MVFSIYGTDSYRVSEKLKELKTGFIQKRDKSGLNVITLDGEKITPADFQSESLTTPFLGDKKMVVVKNLISNKKVAKEITIFLEENAQRIDNIICFVDFIDGSKARIGRDGKLTLTGNLFKYLNKGEYAWEFNLLRERELINWITLYTKNNKVSIEPNAISELAIRAGNDLYLVTSEINKLSAFKGDEAITADDVKELTKSKFDDNIFLLVDSIGSKNKQRSLKLISDQINFGSHPLMILSMIARQFKIILKTKDLSATATSLKLHPFVFNKAKSQGNNFETNKLTSILNEILNIEKQLKSGENNPELLLDLFVAKNC